ncbi:hypothetical protein FAVG1_08379 [Fusarium avenaceum]|nr:hypothetical protein FAVG1_08379 [Fusarium avenaceum]
MHLSSFLLIAAFNLVCGQVVDPYPVSNCGGLAGTQLQCPNQPGCCSGGAMCCAGGCCPLSAICVNSGTSDEKCCDLSDKSLCGAAVTQPQSCPTAGGIHASKLCVGVDSDWYCPWGAVCNNAGGGCFRRKNKRDNCDGQAAETATETAVETAAETASDTEIETDLGSLTTDFATTTDSSAPTTSADASASSSETKTSLATSINNLSAVLLAIAFVVAGF